jgi:hypothetical protein
MPRDKLLDKLNQDSSWAEGRQTAEAAGRKTNELGRLEGAR